MRFHRSTATLRGFSLVELTLATIILGLLVVLLFQIYVMISHISVKVGLERKLHNELIFVMQTVQNIIDQGDLQLVGTSPDELEDVYGLTDTVAFSGSDGLYTLERVCQGSGSECFLSLTHVETFPFPQETNYALTDVESVEITNFYAKFLPYGDQAVADNITHEGFWMFVDAQIAEYNEEKWWFRIDQRMQTFFNIRSYQ